MRSIPVLMILAGCLETVEDPCDGSGPASIEIGDAEGTFVPWAEGDTALVDVIDGTYGFEVAVRTEGLDTREPLLFVANVAAGSEAPRSLFAEASLVCQADGSGALIAFVQLANAAQDHESAIALDGERLALEITLEDTAGDVDVDSVEVTIDASSLSGRRRR